jgi:signal peptidase I
VRKGETILSFDILTGDLLFVDRLSYNFVPPKVGSGFVFKTGNIPALKERVGDRYFVKRLVGLPGDTLEVRPPVLWRNGNPIEGSPAFGRNARQEGLYPGYTNTGRLPAGETLTVEPHFYFAMGDNSPDSYDSRGWGFVPEKDVVGRPLFIYYPLTSRWGPAH